MRTSLLSLFLAIALPMAAQPERHVILVVWDGMRPDFISEETTPNLWRLAQRGVFFAHHHPVYLSSTEVNGTAMATGVYPEHSHILANFDYRPAVDPSEPVEIEEPASVRRGDETSGGHYIAVPTLAEILHARGLATCIAGAKQVALLHDRGRRDNAPGVSPVLYEGETLPPKVEDAIAWNLGAFPPIDLDQDKFARDTWTTRALLETLWRNGVPPYSLLWLAEPDASQHATGPGSNQSFAAIRDSDNDLGRVVTELDHRGLLATTDILVVSDHGFSSISRKVDVAAELRAGGLDVARKFAGGPKSGQILAVSEGGSTLFYVGGHDDATCRKLVDALQRANWAGVVLSRLAIDGTFPLHEARIDAPAAPDVVVAMRWSRDRSANGTPGLLECDLPPKAIKAGNHASLSAYDLHNTLVAAGPDFRVGVTDTQPSSNVDVAPTILWCLGLPEEAKKMDGRPLGEALTIAGAPTVQSYDTRRLTAERKFTDGQVWSQYLQISEVNGVRYLDEGDGGLAGSPEGRKD